MTLKVAFVNQKGGVGKTTAVINIGAALAEEGKKVLLVDLDPHVNLSLGMGIDLDKVKYSTFDIYVNELPLAEAIVESEIPNLYVVPSSYGLSALELKLHSEVGRERILKESFDKRLEDYDFIFFDCPPSLGLLTLNALAAADKVIVPTQCHYYAFLGIEKLFDTIDLIKKRINRKLSILGIIIVMYNPRTNLNKNIFDQMMKTYRKQVFKNSVNMGIKIAEASANGKPITKYARSHPGALAYRELAAEFLKKARKA